MRGILFRIGGKTGKVNDMPQPQRVSAAAFSFGRFRKTGRAGAYNGDRVSGADDKTTRTK